MRLLPRQIIKDTVFGIICCIIAVLTIVEPIVLAKLIELATDQAERIKYLWVMASLLVFIIRIALTYYKHVSLALYKNFCVRQLSNRMVNHLLKAKVRCWEEWSAPYITSRVIDELSNINGVLPRFLFDGLLSAIICIIIWILMVKQSVAIALLTMLFVVADYIVAFKLPLTKIFKEANEAMANMRSQATNLFQGLIQVKMGNCFEKEEVLYDTSMKETLYAAFKKSIFTQLQSLSNSVCRQFGYLLVIVFSAVLIAAEQITLAQFTMLISLYNLFWNHTIVAENIIPLYKYGKVSCDRICEVLDLETERARNCNQLHQKIDTIAFEKVSFTYDFERSILRGLTFFAERGKIVSFAGYSGCGKSTILKLLLGFIDKTDGDILLNGKGVNAEDLNSLRPRIAYLSQRGFLFNRSIRDNLLYYNDKGSINDDKILEYLKFFALEDMIKSLPGGLDYILGDNSNTISGGEQQRLCIIRELIKQPDVFIMDECTSSLDPETESKVFKVLKELFSEMIIIQVAHRASTLAYSDMVYVVDNGQVISSGKHYELLQTSEFYQKLLVTMQDDK